MADSKGNEESRFLEWREAGVVNALEAATLAEEEEGRSCCLAWGRVKGKSPMRAQVYAQGPAAVLFGRALCQGKGKQLKS